ncbi:putative F420-0 ABC transporter substrate-binding protein [Cellulomonas sp. ATA003]|uniref:putative F420-0 ABC transporter substrate-binding protein n=1 Tax=Cellulomonas sp. ATA003 TaxID=3073064 RepID=UPI002872CECB|nr:putative F420-0 ABC transporter substrate-binding protein [Cellulomonas sp. ATA003]WNB86874.1 putative F420-0 ABC transporter substrate-binding protein [Cellulomonas sp. ATA003]
MRRLHRPSRSPHADRCPLDPVPARATGDRPNRPAARRTTGALGLLAALVLAGCSSAGAASSGGSADDAPTAGDASASAGAGEGGGGSAGAGQGAEAGYPVTVDNCGFDVTVDAPPERIVTIKSSTTEMLLALGLGDRIVGASFLDGPVPESLAAAATDLPVLSERAPGPEAVLTLEPDLVYAGWESSFSTESAGERAALAELGVASYVSPSACRTAGYQPDPLTFDDVFAEIEEAGRLFGAPQAAADLVADQRARLDDVVPDDAGRTALWYSSGSDVPYVGAGIGAPQLVMDAVGLENIAGDVRDTWTSFAWEEVVAADPDVIVLVDAEWNTAEKKIDVLEGNPATARLTAVREGSYLVVPFPATEAGVRTVDAVHDLAGQLADLRVPE